MHFPIEWAYANEKAHFSELEIKSILQFYRAYEKFKGNTDTT